MGIIAVNGSSLSTPLKELLMCDGIEPGSMPSYQICKNIYEYHPLGAKMTDSPIQMAQSQEREIVIPGSPEERVIKAFKKEWRALLCDNHILNTMRLARIYGISSVAVLAEGKPTNEPIDYKELWRLNIAFNEFDPLNTAGSLVLNQNPNAIDFQKTQAIMVQGQQYHRSRSCIILNEDPIYIGYTSSAFGYVGRSVYQRALFPLKSFINTLVTDDMVTRKAGLLIAMLQQAGSIANRMMSLFAGQKRQLLKEAQTDNVLSIGKDDKIETLNMQNLDGAYGMARRNILENIAASADMPALILLQETFAEGFGEGTEDAKYMAQFISRIREKMQPLYSFFDQIVQYRAWNPEFYKTIQKDFPEYKGIPYNQAFYEWCNAFAATWPNLLREPDSEKAKTEKVKLESVVKLLEVLMPELDPMNKATIIQAALDNFNQLKTMFGTPFELDYEALATYVPPALAAPGEEPGGEPDRAADAQPIELPRIFGNTDIEKVVRLALTKG
jgi:hypothetical protein